jgi:hypothetical protein
MATVPARAAAPVFVAILSVTVPERLLEVAPEIAIHGAALAADHAQPVSVSTATETVPPFAETVVLAGDTPKRHGAASCVSDTWMSFTSTVAWRGDGSAFGLTRYATDPLP